MWTPNRDFNVVIRIQHRTETDVDGSPDISYASVDYKSFCSFKGFHGSESLRSGALGITDGGTITMWYDPLVTVKDRVLLNDDAALAYSVISVENVEMRNEYLILKVSRVVNP